MFPASFIDEILEYRQLGAYFNRAVQRAQDVNRKHKFVSNYRAVGLQKRNLRAKLDDHFRKRGLGAAPDWFLPIKETYQPNYGSLQSLARMLDYYIDAVIDTYQRVERARQSKSWLFGNRVTFLPKLR